MSGTGTREFNSTNTEVSHFVGGCISWVAIWTRVVAAWFMQREGKAGILRSNNILRVSGPTIVTRTH